MDAVDGGTNAIILCIMQKCPLRNGVQKNVNFLRSQRLVWDYREKDKHIYVPGLFLAFSVFIYLFFSWSLYLSSSSEASPPTVPTPGRPITLLQDLEEGRFRLKLALDSAYIQLSAEDTPTLKSVAEASSAPLYLKVSLYR